MGYTTQMFTFTPEFFDQFGFFVFLYITVISVWGLNAKQCLPQWSYMVLLLIGLSGILVDGFIVYIYFLSPFVEAAFGPM